MLQHCDMQVKKYFQVSSPFLSKLSMYPELSDGIAVWFAKSYDLFEKIKGNLSIFEWRLHFAKYHHLLFKNMNCA